MNLRKIHIWGLIMMLVLAACGGTADTGNTTTDNNQPDVEPTSVPAEPTEIPPTPEPVEPTAVEPTPVPAEPTQPVVEATAVETTPTQEILAEAAAVGFNATVTGAIQAELTGPGYFRCTNPTGSGDNMLPGYQEIAIDQRTEGMVQFLFPRNVGVGTYELKSIGSMIPGEDFVGLAFIDPAVIYGRMLSGSLTLEAIPRAAGEAVRGTFELALSNGSNIITVTGAFAFPAPADGVYCS